MGDLPLPTWWRNKHTYLAFAVIMTLVYSSSRAPVTHDTEPITVRVVDGGGKTPGSHTNTDVNTYTNTDANANANANRRRWKGQWDVAHGDPHASDSKERFGTMGLPSRHKSRSVIAFGISTTSRGTGITAVAELPLFKVLLPSLFGTIGRPKRLRFHFWVYLGFDQKDTLYDNLDNLLEIESKFAALRKAFGFAEDDVRLFLYRFEYAPGRSVSALVASDLMRIAYNDGADYLYRVNDDTRLTNSNSGTDWPTAMTDELARMRPTNVGVVGPFCAQGNDAILTHHMTHRKHLQIFGHYYPRVFSDWYSDDYISMVYERKRTRKMRNVVVFHHNPVGTRYTPDYEKKAQLPSELAIGRAAIEAFVSTAKEISYPPSIGRHSFVDLRAGKLIPRDHAGGDVLSGSEAAAHHGSEKVSTVVIGKNTAKVAFLMFYREQASVLASKAPSEDPFFTNFLSSFFETVTAPSSTPDAVYTVYVTFASSNVDRGDRGEEIGVAALTNEQYRSKFAMLFRARASKAGFNPDTLGLRFTVLARGPSSDPVAARAVNLAADAAYKDGAEYLIRVEPRDEYLDKGWVAKLLGTLRAFDPPNVGAAALRCRRGEGTPDSQWGEAPDQVSHPAVHRDHITLLKEYTPGWHMDEYFGVVYRAAGRLSFPEGTLTICAPHADLSAPTKQFVGEFLPARVSAALATLGAAITQRTKRPYVIPGATADPKDLGKIIGIGISTTSRGIDSATMESLPFFQVFLPSFLSTSTVTSAAPADRDCKKAPFTYRIYLGFDAGDAVYDSEAGHAALLSLFRKRIAETGLKNSHLGCVTLRALRFKYPRGKSVSALVASDVMRIAYDEGADYLYRLNDDTELAARGWERDHTNALARFAPPNVGVVGPTCAQGNTDILAHHMVHRTHLDIFSDYYPRAFSDWWCDDWISYVYGAARSLVLKGSPVGHHNPHGTRYTVTWETQTKLKPELDSGRLAIDTWLRGSQPRGAHSVKITFDDIGTVKDVKAA